METKIQLKGSEIYRDTIQFLQRRFKQLPFYTIFRESILAFEESANDLDNEQLLSSLVMCRNTIDSAIYIAIIHRRISNCISIKCNRCGVKFSSLKSFESHKTKEKETKQLWDFINDVFNSNNLTLNKSDIKNRLWKWSYMEIRSNELRLLTKKELEYINKNIREHGNFSAHIASGIIQAYVNNKKSLPELPTKDKVIEVLSDTSIYLKKLIISYFNNRNLKICQKGVSQPSKVKYLDYIITPIIKVI